MIMSGGACIPWQSHNKEFKWQQNSDISELSAQINLDDGLLLKQGFSTLQADFAMNIYNGLSNVKSSGLLTGWTTFVAKLLFDLGKLVWKGLKKLSPKWLEDFFKAFTKEGKLAKKVMGIIKKFKMCFNTIMIKFMHHSLYSQFNH